MNDRKTKPEPGLGAPKASIGELPNLHSDYALDSDAVSSFRRDGHILLRGVADGDEIAAYRPRIADAVKRLNRNNKPLEDRDTYGKAFIQISNIWTQDEAVRRFSLARRFAKIAAELMGVDAVRIYHDQALFKEPGGGITPWHQDQIYWPLDTADTITMWMPLVPLRGASGTLDFASGSHLHGYISKTVISDQSHKTLKEYIAHHGFPVVNHGPMDAGDATFHYGWTVHSAPGNATDTMREVMTVIYFADGARLLEPETKARIGDRDALMPDVAVGDRIDGRLVPAVYRKADG